MYCSFCGKQVAEYAAFCGHCGKPVPQGSELVKLVAAARTGDQDAISALYEKTYSKVFYTVKSMIKDEDAVFDIVQDTYLKAFAHLDAFEGDTKFLPWVRQIAANTARDWLKKKRPVLFAELASDDGQDTPVEELLPDTRSEDLPDRVIDQKETKRLLREILEELPEDQRAAIGMFYYEEMSVKQIAAAMGASESAVKSRLMYARGKIEKKVRELEKKGTKLYNLAPLPFLLLLFRGLKTGAAEAPDAQILQAVLASQRVGAAAAAGAVPTGTAAGGGATGGAGAGTTGTAAGGGATGGAGAGTTGTAAGGGAAGGAGASGVAEAGTAGAATGAEASGAAEAGTAGAAAGAEASGVAEAGTAGAAAGAEASGVAEAGTTGAAAGVEASGAAAAGTAGTAAGAGGTAAAAGGFSALKLGIIALAAAAVIGIGAFGVAQTDPRSAEPSGTPSIEDPVDRENAEMPGGSVLTDAASGAPDAADAAPEELTPIDAALEQYRTIVRRADSYDYGEGLVPTGYQYALVQMRPDDPVPTLLLEMDTEDFISYVRFFQYDPDTKTVHQPAETAMAGVAGVGGYRGSLAMAGDGMGMLYTQWSGGTGETTITRITLNGDSLSRDVYWTGRFDLIPDTITRTMIDWHEIGNLSALDSWTALESGEAVLSDAGGSGALPTDGDRIVLTGTVGTYGYDEIVKMLGIPDPLPAVPGDEGSEAWFRRNATYHVIVLDAPQTLSLGDPASWDGTGTSFPYRSGEVMMISIHALDNMDQYEGRHITFSIEPDTTRWPYDYVLPGGQPLTEDIHILD